MADNGENKLQGAEETETVIETAEPKLADETGEPQVVAGTEVEEPKLVAGMETEETESLNEKPATETEEPKVTEQMEEAITTESMEKPTDLEKKIIRQIEYYFGDINLPKDRFMQDAIKEDNGWIPLDTMTKFNRLKLLTEDLAAIATAVKKSKSGLLEVNEDNTKVRRCPGKPIPENTAERRQELQARTAYVKGFPLDITLDKLFDFFDTFGQLNNIYMRRDQKKVFKSSVFATFDQVEDFQKFMAEPVVTWEDKELIKKTKDDYLKGKDEEKKQRKEEKAKKREKSDEKQQEDQKKQFEHKMTKQAILHLKGFSEETTREDIKNLLQDHGQIAWVDFNKGDTEAWVRYDEEGAATEVLEKVNAAMDNNITLNENQLEGRVLEGEEEVEKWQKMFQDMAEKRNKKSRYQGNKKFGQKFGKRPYKSRKGHDKGDGAEQDTNGPPQKQAKVADD